MYIFFISVKGQSICGTGKNNLNIQLILLPKHTCPVHVTPAMKYPENILT